MCAEKLSSQIDEKMSKNPFLGRLFLSTRLFIGPNFFPVVLEYPCMPTQCHGHLSLGASGEKRILNFWLNFLNVLPLDRAH